MCYEERYYSEWAARKRREDTRPTAEPHNPELHRQPPAEPAKPADAEHELETTE